jgi:type IV secretion system protein VirD4
MIRNRLLHQTSLTKGSVLLGWRAEPLQSFGFSSGSSTTKGKDDPILYQGDGHLLTVAPTRSGKGRGVLIPNLLYYDGPVVVFDPKGELHRVTARRRREMGQRVVTIDPWQVLGTDSDRLNAFDVFSLAKADLETDAQMMADWLSQGNRGTKEPFWDIQGSSLLTALITYVATRPPAERNLEAVRKLLLGDDPVYGLAVLLDTQGKAMNRMAYDDIASFLATTDVTRSGILSTATAYLKPFLSSRLAGVLSDSTFDLGEVVSGAPLSIYLVLPPDKLKSHRSILKMWVGTLLKAVMSRDTIPPRRTLILFDECAQLENFPYLETIITLCAGYGVQCWTFWQDLAQLQSCYPTSWQTLLNNCEVLQSFGIRNRHMADQWGKYLDHSPESLMGLPSDRQVVRHPSEGELCCRRPDYLRDATFHGLYDQNPLYPAGADEAGAKKNASTSR